MLMTATVVPVVAASAWKWKASSAVKMVMTEPLTTGTAGGRAITATIAAATAEVLTVSAPIWSEVRLKPQTTPMAAAALAA
jgi:hypothetical protein